MTAPRVVVTPDDGERLDQRSLHVDDAALGDVLTKIEDPDNPGEFISEFAPSGTDPGVPAGTPGNWSHEFITESGRTYVLGKHDTDPEPLVFVGMLRRPLIAGAFIRGQGTVVAAGAETAYLDLRVSLDDGATWEDELFGIRLPLKAAKHAVGFAVEVPDEFVGDVLLHPVVVAGDGTLIPKVRGFRIESTSAEPPPADGEDEPVVPDTPGVPGLLDGYWPPSEGTGSTIASKEPAPDGPDMTVVDLNEAASWSGGPDFIVLGGGDYLVAAGMPTSPAAGFSAFFVVDVTNIGTADKWLMAVNGSATLDHEIIIDDATKKLVARAWEAGPSQVTTALSDAALATNTTYMLGVVRDVVNGDLHLYINPDDGAPHKSASIGAPITFGAPPAFILGSGDVAPAARGGPNNKNFGTSLVKFGTILSPTEIANLYLQWRDVEGYDLP